MNVFRRFTAEPKAMYEFYGEVLGLKQLTTFDVGKNPNVARFQAGDSQLKLTARTPNRQYHPGTSRRLQECASSPFTSRIRSC